MIKKVLGIITAIISGYQKKKPGEESTGLRDYIRGIILA